MPFPSKNHATSARTHSESRASLCAVCFTKKRVRPAKPDTEAMIRTCISPYFSLKKDNLPSGICENCKKVLLANRKVKQALK